MTRRSGFRLFLVLFALYLLTYSPTFHSSDGLAMFSTAESLVRRGAWDIEQIRWMGLQQGTYGLDGLLYSRKGIGQPLLALPLTWLGLLIPFFGPATATLLFGSLVAALSGLLIYLILKRLGYADRTALLAALVYGTGTLAWPYAKTFFSDPLAGLLLLLTTYALLMLDQTDQGRYAFIAGFGLAWSVATRYASGVFLPVFGLLFLAYLWRKSPGRNQAEIIPYLRTQLPKIVLFSLPILLVGVGLMTFNLLRYGDPFNTGYLPEESFSAIWWQGILGQLISPGRGLLLYSPILLISFLGLKPFWQRHRLAALACLAVILIHLLLYGKWFMWHGGFAWGPRFMIPTLPFWALLMAPWLERLPNKPSWRIGFYLLWTASVLVQLPGLAVDFDLWQNRLLETGLPLFAPPTFFQPTYSPLLGTWQYINPANLDIAWMHNSQIDWLLLGSLLLNIGLSGWLLLKQFRQPTEQTMRPIDYLAGLLALLVTGLLLFQAHQSQPPGLMTAMAEVNRTPAPLIYNEPELAVPLAERYRGHQPVLGLFTPEPARLAEFTAAAPAVWWLGSDGSGIEAQLLADYAVARQDTYGEQALWLFARSDGPAQPVEAQFGDITLKTVRLSSTPRAQAPLAVELIWEAEQTPASNYQVFLHLLNANGETVAQADGQPVHWTRPTTTWQPAETISDRYALWLPALPPGPYTLIAGLYQPENGQRLTTSANQDAVQLANFTLQ